MFKGKSSPPQNFSSIPCPPKKHLSEEHQKQTLLSWKIFYRQLKRSYSLTSNEITLKTILLKMNEDLLQFGEEM